MTTHQEENKVTTMQEVAVTDRHIAIVHQVQYNLHLKVHLIRKNPSQRFAVNCNPHDLVGTVIDNDYLDVCKQARKR